MQATINSEPIITTLIERSFSVRIGFADSVLSAEAEWSHKKQASQVGYSLLGSALPAPVDPRRKRAANPVDGSSRRRPLTPPTPDRRPPQGTRLALPFDRPRRSDVCVVASTHVGNSPGNPLGNADRSE